MGIILYRMARELLINAVKHSRASNVNIIIKRERLLALGGNLKIISEQEKGLIAVMTCPLKLREGEIFHDKNIVDSRL